MKYIIYILFPLFYTSINAQSIVGKWKCPKGAFEQLGSHYKYLRGHCRFKADGTFEVKLNSTWDVPGEYSTFIKVKGTYTMTDGRITTHINWDGVYCNAPNDTPNPYIEPQKELNDGYYRSENRGERKYDVASGVKDLQENSREAELVREWNWTNEKVTVSKKALDIENKARLRK